MQWVKVICQIRTLQMIMMDTKLKLILISYYLSLIVVQVSNANDAHTSQHRMLSRVSVTSTSKRHNN